jgi:hypothetical protein
MPSECRLLDPSANYASSSWITILNQMKVKNRIDFLLLFNNAPHLRCLCALQFFLILNCIKRDIFKEKLSIAGECV